MLGDKYDITSVWLVLWQLCDKTPAFSLFETRRYRSFTAIPFYFCVCLISTEWWNILNVRLPTPLTGYFSELPVSSLLKCWVRLSTIQKLSVVAICHKSGGPGHLSPSFNPPFFPSLSWTPRGSGHTPPTRYQTFWSNLYV